MTITVAPMTRAALANLFAAYVAAEARLVDATDARFATLTPTRETRAEFREAVRVSFAAHLAMITAMSELDIPA